MSHKGETSMNGFMFDTNIFNQILDDEIDCNLFSGINCFVTHIQNDEIFATKDSDRRTDLVRIFLLIDKNTIPTETALFGLSRFGQSKYGDRELFNNFLNCLNEKKRKQNNNKDALIAETAIKNNFMLVTNDETLSIVMIDFGGNVCKLGQVTKK
jgi:hypothetical protein